METNKTIETWAAEKGHPDYLLAAAKASTPGWATGREVPEADFDAVMARVSGLSMKPA